MIQIPEVGDVVKVKEFYYKGSLTHEGKEYETTGMSRPFGISKVLNDKTEYYTDVAQVKITKAWEDYETGWRYWAEPHDDVKLMEYLKRNSKHTVVYVSQFDVVK